MRGGSRLARCGWLIAAVLAAATVGETRLAHADRVAELTQTLSSSSEKTRLAAVVALGKLGDKRAMKPLVTALADPSPQIRLVAAAALGTLGHKAALPALKGLATGDSDPKVQTVAREAANAVAKANQLPSPWPAPATAAATPAAGAAAPAGAGRPATPGFGTQPRAVGPAPELYVLINSSADESPGKTDKVARKEHAEIIRKALVDECHATPAITTAAADAKRLGLDARHIDVSVVKIDVTTAGELVEVGATLRLAVSDAKGKMLSFVSGGAKVQIPKLRFDARNLPRMRRDALEGAARGLFEKLVTHLRAQRATS